MTASRENHWERCVTELGHRSDLGGQKREQKEGMETIGDRAAAEAAAVDLGRCRSLCLLLPDPHPSQSFPKGYTIRTRDIWLSGGLHLSSRP